MDGHVCPLINVQLCSEVVVRRRSELDERISKSDMGIQYSNYDHSWLIMLLIR